MDLLNAACALFVTVCCAATHPAGVPPANNQRVAQWNGYIGEAARRFDVPEDWIRAVMAQESAGLTIWKGRPITSAKGAMGLMQLMPDTWNDLHNRLHLGNDPYDPHDNILAGTAYLRSMADRFGTGAFAAYNAGPNRYTTYLDGRAPLPQETRAYLNGITATAAVPKPGRPRDMLFVVNNSASLAPSEPPSRAGDGAADLFVPLGVSSR